MRFELSTLHTIKITRNQLSQQTVLCVDFTYSKKKSENRKKFPLQKKKTVKKETNKNCKKFSKGR